MRNKQNENMITISKNPFDDYNANVLAPELIMQYWYTPFNVGAFKDFDESRFFAEKMPIILQGSRGSGKTTILKYFSFPVQCERALQNNISIVQQLKNDGGVGFYLRCDDSFLNMFKSVFSFSMKDTWQECFRHYLELFFSKSILSMINKIGFADEETETGFISELNLEKTDEAFSFSKLNQIEEYIDAEIRYINKYKNEALFTEAKFAPKHFWDFFELSEILIKQVQISFPVLADVNYLLLVDEFENLPTELQEVFNSLIKFCKPGMSFRIGRRSENVVTKATINKIEYLREDNDYKLVILDFQGDEIKDLKPYLSGIAKKRLEAFEGIDIPKDISRILGDKENLDEECLRIISGHNRHLYDILKTNPTIKSDDNLCKDLVNTISCVNNPIAVALCALWVSRSNDADLRAFTQNAVGAMTAYFNKTDHPDKEKFKNDYDNKYRYALTSLICSLYKKDKAYYSFNTICYLSEGNTRTFINLIKAIISDALFYERKSFLAEGKISVECQCRAIREFASSEFNSVCSIIQGGKKIKNLILGIGNVLSEYHKDKLVRYPETTQFAYNYDELIPDSKTVVSTAEGWGLIKKRKQK